MWLCVCMCACVNSRWVDIIFMQFLTVVDAIEANAGVKTRRAPLLPKKLVFKFKVLLTGHLWAYYFLMHYASVCEAILR